MSQDVKTLVRSLSGVAHRFLQNGDRPPISGATIDAWGRLEMVQPPPLDRYSPKRQVEHLEASYRRAATLGLCRACAHMLDGCVRDPTGTDRQAILVAVETSAGLALDVFIPFHDDRPPVGGTVDPDATFVTPRRPRIFQCEERAAELAVGSPANDSSRMRPTPLATVAGRQDEERPTRGHSRPGSAAEVQTLLLAAIVRNDDERMGKALRQGARLDEPLLGQTPVDMALRAEAVGALDWLLAQGAALPALDLDSWRKLRQPGKAPLLRTLVRRGLRVPAWYPVAHRLLRRGPAAGEAKTRAASV